MLEISYFPSYHSQFYSFNSTSPYFMESDPSSLDEEDEEEGDIPEPFQLSGKQFEFILNDQFQPAILCENQKISSVENVIQLIHPSCLITESDLIKWALMINFLAGGGEYKFIDKVEQFKKKYSSWAQDVDQNYEAYFLALSTPHSFKIDEITPPHVQGQNLIFYVHKNQIPFRVVVPLFAAKGNYKVHYQTLDFNES